MFCSEVFLYRSAQFENIKNPIIDGYFADPSIVNSMNWEDGKVTKATVLNKSGNKGKLIYAGKIYDLDIEKGKSADLKL